MFIDKLVEELKSKGVPVGVSSYKIRTDKHGYAVVNSKDIPHRIRRKKKTKA